MRVAFSPGCWDSCGDGDGRRQGLDHLGDVRTVRRVLYLIFNQGYSGDVDLASEAIRLTRQLASSIHDPEVDGLLALMLLHHARRRSRTRPDGRIVPLADQDRSLWDTELIAEGIAIVQAALARDRLGQYQTQAAIAALHADAKDVEDTDPPLCRRSPQRAQPR